MISATIKNAYKENEITVSTNDNKKRISIPVKADGYGSQINGGELLYLALATCFCNDIYREAGKRNMDINSVIVTVSGNFEKEGEPSSAINYEVKVESLKASKKEIDDLIQYVDSIAEVHNTIRKGTSVKLMNTI